MVAPLMHIVRITRFHRAVTSAARFTRGSLAGMVVLAATPVLADPLDADAAKAFVVGRNFSYTCFEGTSGAGRVMSDGSVAGSISMRGKTPTRFVALPAGTLKVKGEAVCASLKTMPFEPCFALEKTSETSFRGTLAGFDKFWCEFNRSGTGRNLVARRKTPEQTAEIQARN